MPVAMGWKAVRGADEMLELVPMCPSFAVPHSKDNG